MMVKVMVRVMVMVKAKVNLVLRVMICADCVRRAQMSWEGALSSGRLQIASDRLGRLLLRLGCVFCLRITLSPSHPLTL